VNQNFFAISILFQPDAHILRGLDPVAFSDVL
jgi:hypothetical protein